MFDHGIGAGKEKRLMAAVAPPNAVRWSTVVAGLQHFTVAVRLTDAVTLDYDSITRTGSHFRPPVLPTRGPSSGRSAVGARVQGPPGSPPLVIPQPVAALAAIGLARIGTGEEPRRRANPRGR
jgi:hypothetical protein